jgi:hypothetical protein
VCLVILFRLGHGSKESVSTKICTLAQPGLESELYAVVELFRLSDRGMNIHRSDLQSSESDYLYC